jgi:hypothetical protein
MENKKEDISQKQFNLVKKLFVSESKKYGDNYIDHLIEQYKIYINATEKISDRRQKTNEFFLGLNAALVTLLGFIATKSSTDQIISIIPLASIAGTVICFLWHSIIASYKGLNSAKFEVIHTIEQRLPLALYDSEWELVGRGENQRVYWPFSHIELWVPRVFIGIYIIIILSLIPYSLLINFIADVMIAWKII